MNNRSVFSFDNFIMSILVTLMLLALSGCAHRALVKDCQPAGPDLQNCEIVKDL